jgi:NAD-dependent dihydropyrimidine dehydrogenase PreA subunit
MFDWARRAAKGAAARSDHAACSGCSLCLLVCPAWRSTHDPRLTPEGRAKALQHGASLQEVAASVQACTLCGACEPVCPEEIDLVGMTLDLRTRLADVDAVKALQSHMETKAAYPAAPVIASVVLLPGPAMRAMPEALARIAELLGGTACADDGADLAQAIESGVPIPGRRLESFLAHLRGTRTIVVEDGLWMRPMRAWLPKARVVGLGEALSSLEAVRRGLRKTDLYVIEPRAYHGDYQRLVKHYDRLRVERGCALNLDLQRIAMPPAGQAGWILKGRRVDRIVVERQEDAEAFARHGGCPVVHLAELADH